MTDIEGNPASQNMRSNSFVSREAFEDVKVACHFAVLLIGLHAEYYPDQPVTLNRTGGDPVEDLWSALGSWVRNKRTFSLLEAKQTLRSLVVVHRAMSAGSIKVPERRRGADTWDDKQPGVAAASLFADLDRTTRSALWQQGTHEAYVDATADGMKPSPIRGRGQHAEYPRWWTHPYEYDPDILRKNANDRNAAGRDEDEMHNAHDGEEELSDESADGEEADSSDDGGDDGGDDNNSVTTASSDED